MTAFRELSRRMQHGVADRLHWDGLRPVQEASIGPILAGENLIVLAPTAGGKTEAAFLPALDILSREGITGVGILYVSPLVALLNNQEERVAQLADLVGLRAFKWHGGVNSSARKRFLNDPAEALLSTPESLEAMLIGRYVPVNELFAQLRFVIIDEVHAFAGSDRGAHLISVIERLARFSAYDVQRIGLSATVQNPMDIGRWLKGRSQRKGRLIDPHKTANEKRAHIHAITTKDAASDRHLGVLNELVAQKKSLLFTESRADAEVLAKYLDEALSLDYISTYHSAISTSARQEAEDAMNSQQNRFACITCTSAMELGIDIGGLDTVVQWGPPGSVSSLLQRWGRTGRRAHNSQNTTIVTTLPWETLTATALVTLALGGWVEAVHPPTRAYHILFQQMINVILQRNGGTPQSIWKDIEGIPAFKDVSAAEFERLLHHLLSTDVLRNPGGTLVLGDHGEEQLSARHFQRLIVSFETPEEYTVVDINNQFEVGVLELFFVEQLRKGLEQEEVRPIILLAGRAWQIQRINDDQARIEVVRYLGGKPPKWQSGALRIIDERVAERHREILLGDVSYGGMNETAAEQLQSLQRTWQATLQTSALPFTTLGRNLELHTFAGTRINATLEHYLAPHVSKASSDAFSLEVRLHDGQEPRNIFALLEQASRGISLEAQALMTQGLTPVRISKYQPFLPGDMAVRIAADYLFAIDETEMFLRRRLDQGAYVKSTQ